MQKAKRLICLALTTNLLFAVTPAYAQQTTPQPTSNTRSPSPRIASPSPTNTSRPQSSPTPNTSTPNTNTRNQIEARKQELTTQNNSNVQKLTQAIVTRMNAAQKRQQNILGRIESRVGKLKEQKINTVQIERSISSLNKSLVTQQALIDAIVPELDTMLSSNNSQALSSYRQAIISAKESIQKSQLTLESIYTELLKISKPLISPNPTLKATSSVKPSATVSAKEE